MKVLLVGADRDGSLLRSLERGLHDWCEVSVVDPAFCVTRILDKRSALAFLRRRLKARGTSARFLEAVDQLRPDVTLIVKGRGIDPGSVLRARHTTQVAIYYPDNPFWMRHDTPDAHRRLAVADVAVVWSTRLRDRLQQTCRRVEVIPFGYDDRWFSLTDPCTPREGVAFLGTWHPRRERYLRALHGLPLTIAGSGWHKVSDMTAAAPIYGIEAGALLRRAAIGINVLHPQNAGAHNMRTREVAASGALQLTDSGVDGTPLRDGESCRWFHSPRHLRDLVEHYLTNRTDAHDMARSAQALTGLDTYRRRAQQLLELLRDAS